MTLGTTSAVAIRATVAAGLRALNRLGRGDLATRLSYSRVPQKLAQHGTVHAKRIGLWLTLDLRDNVARTLYLAGTYETAQLDLLRSSLGPGDVYIDVGGHIGLDALVAARAGARVYAFEPSEDTAEKLRWAVERNGLSHLIGIEQIGLGTAHGELELRGWEGYEDDAAQRSFHGKGKLINVARVERFDDWANRNGVERVDAIKIDVEGAECDVLEGMRRTLTGLGTRFISVEVVAAREVAAGREPGAIAELLASYGYRSQEAFLDNIVFRPA